MWYDVSYHEDVNDERHAVWVRPRWRATEKVYFDIIKVKSHNVIMSYNDSTIDFLMIISMSLTSIHLALENSVTILPMEEWQVIILTPI